MIELIGSGLGSDFLLAMGRVTDENWACLLYPAKQLSEAIALTSTSAIASACLFYAIFPRAFQPSGTTASFDLGIVAFVADAIIGGRFESGGTGTDFRDGHVAGTGFAGAAG